MTRTLDVRRSLAATAALVVAAVGATALPAAADPGNGNGNGQGNGHSQSDTKDKKDKKDKGDKGPKSPQGPKDDKEPKEPKGPKGPQGPKDDKEPKGPKGPQGPKDDKEPKGPKGPKDPGNGDPAGNNGTVKITPIGQDDGIPQNNPHVPCGFDIEWYGFDEGDDIISTVTLTMHAPTKDVELTPGGPSEVFVGGDPATGAGTETGFDGEATYYPTFVGEPHPQQGYHIKLTIHTPGSQGADTKHKVFWVEPCEEETPAGEEETPEGEEPCAEGDMTEECDDTVVEGEEETDEDSSSTDDSSTNDETEVLGEQETAADTEVMGAQANANTDAAQSDVPNAVDAGDEGNPVLDFVRSPIPLLVIGLGALLAALAFASRRRSTNV